MQVSGKRAGASRGGGRVFPGSSASVGLSRLQSPELVLIIGSE